MSYESSDAKDLFLQAFELTNPEQRSAFLDRACQGNAELRARVDRLLQSHENPDSFLGQTAWLTRPRRFRTIVPVIVTTCRQVAWSLV